MDERVAMAISHWSPRFTTNGVSAGDFARITGGLERWAGWCAAWSEVAAEHEQFGRDALAAGRHAGGSRPPRERPGSGVIGAA
jgi:2,6-dihydroxypseudooxynicotine hydrolase